METQKPLPESIKATIGNSIGKLQSLLNEGIVPGRTILLGVLIYPSQIMRVQDRMCLK